MDKATQQIRLQQWVAIIHEANGSDLSKKAWCKENNISLRQFYYWQRKIRGLAAEAALETNPCLQQRSGSFSPAPGTESSSFCEIPLPKEPYWPSEDPAAPAPSASFHPEIMIKINQFQILVGSGAHMDTLEKVLSVIRRV